MKQACEPKEVTCNVCIIGAGPAGLAVLSAIKEPYTLDTMNETQIEQAQRILSSSSSPSLAARDLEVCVIDGSEDWMADWDKNFATLDIQFLRSPALAHPDAFDPNALLAFAVANGREDELIDSGCRDLKCLRGLDRMNLWKLPSTKLFHDFCLNMARRPVWHTSTSKATCPPFSQVR